MRQTSIAPKPVLDLAAPVLNSPYDTDGEPALSFQQPVPRHLVHRASVAEVLLTDSVRLDDSRFLVAAQWPRDHALHNPDATGRTDPLLFAETIRQMFVYLPHTYFGVPLTHRFIGDRLNFDLDDAAPLRVGAAPLNVVLEAEWRWEGNRPPNRYGMRLDVALTIDGKVYGRGMISGIAVDERRYSLLRRRKADELAAGDAVRRLPVAPAAVGRLRDKDCVLAQGFLNGGARDGSWWLRVNTDHPIFFDHPSDHVPLMVAMEGARQLGHVLVHEGNPGAPLALVSAQVECLAFGELDLPTRLVVEEADEPTGDPSLRRLRVGAYQNGRPFVTVTTLWSRPVVPRLAFIPQQGVRV
ncbi:ScbA/BarX family gamma-butyrolactone biosynthesis protein [Streptomyces sp. NPDC056670]|uniref:ScbA/BarX family gamma-butyrolactone biosynthesis protein n=1 Tax=Streptomyces sp. NPDC056670 TaxID=3345904 RepID=UPI00369757BE